MPSLRIPLDWCASLLLGAGTLLPALPEPATGAPRPTAMQAAPPTAPAQPLFDCNENGVEDSVDIAVGTSSDANWNAVPDECEGLPDTRDGSAAGLRRDARPSDIMNMDGGELPVPESARAGVPPHDE